MSEIHAFSQVKLAIATEADVKPGTTWVQQSVSPEVKGQFQLLLNGPAEASTLQSGNAPEGVAKSPWDDTFKRQALIEAVAALENLQPHQIPAAAAKVTMISLDMQMKVDAVRQGSKSTEDSVQSLMRT